MARGFAVLVAILVFWHAPLAAMERVYAEAGHDARLI
jgi:hypothetical protein